MLRFYVALGLLTLLIGSAIELGAGQALFSRPSFGWEIVAILSFFTALIYYRLSKIQASNFTQAYLLTIVLKLLLGGILISVILFIDSPLAAENAFVFIVNYLLFTALEVYFLFRRVNTNPKSKS